MHHVPPALLHPLLSPDPVPSARLHALLPTSRFPPALRCWPLLLHDCAVLPFSPSSPAPPSSLHPRTLLPPPLFHPRLHIFDLTLLIFISPATRTSDLILAYSRHRRRRAPSRRTCIASCAFALRSLSLLVLPRIPCPASSISPPRPSRPTPTPRVVRSAQLPTARHLAPPWAHTHPFPLLPPPASTSPQASAPYVCRSLACMTMSLLPGCVFCERGQGNFGHASNSLSASGGAWISRGGDYNRFYSGESDEVYYYTYIFLGILKFIKSFSVLLEVLMNDRMNGFMCFAN
ncbi:hypothetical protein C8R44DRAFT_881731 [Mycena epipterygia]|nr:hypothetical protein C8R44DRAFT_881731 [Mycena epipterygia]